MSASVKVTVDSRSAQNRFRGMIRRMQSFKPVFRWAFKEIQAAHAANFATNGAVDGSPWKPLDPQYAAWKIENYGANGILVRTGELRSSLTIDNARGAIREIRRQSATFGTDIPYAKFHQRGTQNMPERPPIISNDLVYAGIGDKLAEYIVDGNQVLKFRNTFKRRRF